MRGSFLFAESGVNPEASGAALQKGDLLVAPTARREKAAAISVCSIFCGLFASFLRVSQAIAEKKA
jgi:hypothetical protein